jgi:hypothetical protein
MSPADERLKFFFAHARGIRLTVAPMNTGAEAEPTQFELALAELDLFEGIVISRFRLLGVGKTCASQDAGGAHNRMLQEFTAFDFHNNALKRQWFD